ncbi:hypothetical protein JOC75_000446 [Metabacillus crassostreae]|uniref:hypothetical protein n=1 Tax=Metabacillus crassostreae TaxID=929098 RepID=UPI00195EAC74|nr:hypothetical protein [Metabacillus crassostreae]MBM7602476.1 hypothetical protein [Metabacillus crassostreae]
MSVFIQYSHISIVNSVPVNLKNENFTIMDIGLMLRDEDDFTYKFIANSFSYPIFFVLHTLMLDDEEMNKIKHLQIDYLTSNENKNWIVVKIINRFQLKLVSEYCEWFACLGLGSLLLQGDNLQFEHLLPIFSLSDSGRLPNFDWMNVKTIIEIDEVGFTVITKDERINSTTKLIQYIPKEYAIDLGNSDF